MLPLIQVALAVGEPHEARLLGMLEDPAFQVSGRGCAVATFCSTIRELRDALGRTDSIDVVVMSSTLQALPKATLDELVGIGSPLVVVAPDPSASRWADFPAPVLGPDAETGGLAAAIAGAVLGSRAVKNRNPKASTSRTSRATAARNAGNSVLASDAPARPRGEVITVTSVGSSEGRTAAVAVPLAYALSFAAATVLLDVNSRGSAVEFHLPVDPARGLPQLGRRTRTGPGWSSEFDDDRAWQAALEAELQSMGTGQGWVACGVSTPAYREYLSDALLERVVATLRTSHRFIVLDSSGGGWSPDDPAVDRAALQVADRLLVVLRPDEQGIERARRLLSDPANRRYRERIGLVLNQVGLDGTNEAIGAIEFALGTPVAAVLPFDAQHLARARSQHRPVVCEPGCRLSAPLLRLASRLAGGGPIRVPVASPSTHVPWWRRLAVAPAALFR